MGFRLRPQARRDIAAIMNYISRDNPAAALKWQDDLFVTFSLLGDFAQSGSARNEIRQGLRIFPKGNYLIFYEQVATGVSIVRVLHAARNWPATMR
ncbi:toxin ParE1/3/4 [Rhizobium sp. SG_E_25_P2]|uniref:type II toxin-antitoxin system RelE/ParE family toxin n=1 Tax=Rhizobium sp. SG_E_25_P2 TaxID=2879942 RepID=UPI0024761550|nr:type II toxin-antitoxin system RelE/ParE family toxin [Rhizobium sp. SG_E_25_P2]MDH6267125.1 toxin ParE1/3/4 [Rhizobium sp. SG_E_25_P2]